MSHHKRALTLSRAGSVRGRDDGDEGDWCGRPDGGRGGEVNPGVAIIQRVAAKQGPCLRALENRGDREIDSSAVGIAAGRQVVAFGALRARADVIAKS